MHSCDACPIGSYSDSTGAKVCKICDDLTPFTEGLAANSSDFCRQLPSVNSTFVMEEYAKLKSSQKELTCDDVLMIDVQLTDPTMRDVILQRRKSQLGNGLCNRGPFNVAECGWDGGDCCIQSCKISSDDDEVDQVEDPEDAPRTLACARLATAG